MGRDSRERCGMCGTLWICGTRGEICEGLWWVKATVAVSVAVVQFLGKTAQIKAGAAVKAAAAVAVVVMLVAVGVAAEVVAAVATEKK